MIKQLQRQVDALAKLVQKQSVSIAALESVVLDLKLRAGVTKPPPDHCTPKQYADAMGLSLQGVHSRIRRKKIIATKLNGVWHIARTELPK